MLAVTVPAQVRRKQLVVATGPGQVDMLEHHRWIGPLADEIQQALSLEVSNRLGAIDVNKTPYPDGAAPWRISTNVQRFESVSGRVCAARRHLERAPGRQRVRADLPQRAARTGGAGLRGAGRRAPGGAGEAGASDGGGGAQGSVAGAAERMRIPFAVE
jgi:uncharacterized membrane protein YgcG